MQPQIQYARTSDGVSIAFTAIGQGPAVIAFGMPATHLQVEWEAPENQRAYENAGRVSTFIRFDPRGFGLSDRDVTTFSPASMALDLEAIVQRIGAERFSLIALSWAGMVAIEYAARHPDSVSRMVLEQASARGSDYMNEQLKTLGELAQHDWELASESIYHFFAGWANHEQARFGARVLRAAVTPQTLARFIEQMSQHDVSDYLSRITLPVLSFRGHGPAVWMHNAGWPQRCRTRAFRCSVRTNQTSVRMQPS
jgi:pimeloyl-ACP methyl ester carboxylesterase